MAKVSRLEDLPDWFDLREYESCVSFNAFDWLIVLKDRASILELISKGDNVDANDLAERARKDPTDCFRFDWQTPESPVRPLSFGDIAFKSGIAVLAGSASSSKAEQWIGTLNMISTGNWLSASLNKEAIENRSDHSRSLSVNLLANDSVLMDAFNAWLKDARSQQDAVSKRELPAYKSWASYGLLPYLDLFIWMELTENRISYQLMSEAVGYRKGGDSFRKTVPKLRIEIAQHLAELEALASIEECAERLTA
ncbi:DUF6387 family protein [Pseudomonas sp. SST3]|uniref:DUF6387 family protein n=1 Tax=Pseudomonas sp. SST3 TaxID=2267882 RepID=UPI000E045D13|nr:DUF6387 family protein [Pseudomonas sp. SST3]NKQ11985.1 hypothetical protein [Pseudomonas sp. SST3]